MMKNTNKKIPLDSKTVLLQTSIQDILKKTYNKKDNKRKGIDFRLYTVDGSSQKGDIQTVLTALSSRYNPDQQYQVAKSQFEELLAESLDKVLLSDNVKSCNDYYKTNNKSSSESSNTMFCTTAGGEEVEVP